MAYDEGLAERVRDAVAERATFTEQKMFGALVFMVNTHMAVGVMRDELLVRVGTDGREGALADGAHEASVGRGMVAAPPETATDDDALRAWVSRGVEFALAAPPKPVKR
ncbi:TfoX/Sxy family protein [Streptomyces sp. CA-179760]|uniref:TfoX/Sxy family protein n=1 Tax=Streptomyces sp. CA-179760 TaxID=3240054 RepID=UPI003D8A71F4